ncbi:MAG: hypothetical protein Q8O89_03300 [Nanoarchaeota archaeon]|nr:hypothetical protein [Nanoarchaeota archaeon]
MYEGLTTVCLDTEEEHIQRFCDEYKDEIVTPDGFVIFCKYPEKTAKHICCGKNGVFQKTRAQRILWPKYILLNPSERIVLIDTTNKSTLFFFTKRRKPHLVVCNELGGKLNLISSFAVGGKRIEKYRNGESPYEFYNFG